MKKSTWIIIIASTVLILLISPFILLWFAIVDDKKMFFHLLMITDERKELCVRGAYLEEKGFKSYIYEIPKDDQYEKNIKKYFSSVGKNMTGQSYLAYYPDKTYVVSLTEYYENPIGPWQKTGMERINNLLEFGFVETNNEKVCDIVLNTNDLKSSKKVILDI